MLSFQFPIDTHCTLVTWMLTYSDAMAVFGSRGPRWYVPKDISIHHRLHCTCLHPSLQHYLKTCLSAIFALRQLLCDKAFAFHILGWNDFFRLGIIHTGFVYSIHIHVMEKICKGEYSSAPKIQNWALLFFNSQCKLDWNKNTVDYLVIPALYIIVVGGVSFHWGVLFLIPNHEIFTWKMLPHSVFHPKMVSSSTIMS